MHKVLVVFGTRPEAIKLAPVVKARIQAAEPVQLERWQVQILTANSPDELFG